MNNSDLISKLENAIQAWEMSNEELRRLLRQHILDLINVAGSAASLGTVTVCNREQVPTVEIFDHTN